MKYIRHRYIGFILFQDTQVHKDFALLLCLEPDDILSAGQVKLYDGVVHCFGESTTLCRSSKTEDSAALQRQLDAYP